MSWKQVKTFNVSKMGTRKNWCLMNARLGFGITQGKYASAKADMEGQRKSGTLHAGYPPANISVPVYVDSTSPYEHVVVCDHGNYYSDGVLISKPKYIFGWGELCDGVRVVKWEGDARKSTEEVANEVIAGKWGNGNSRKKNLEKAGYDYNTVQNYVNKLLGSVQKSNTQIAKEVIAGKWGNGYDRKRRLEKAGYNYNAVQAIVNTLLK
jgi:hypothetical protein